MIQANNMGLLLAALVGLAALVIVAILALVVLRPGQDNTQTIITITGVALPISSAIIAMMVRNGHNEIKRTLGPPPPNP